MELKKCPRCELNYIREDEKLCSVCSNSGRSRQISDDSHMVCSECGENRPMPGKTVCAACYKELRRMGYNSDDDILTADELDIDFDSFDCIGKYCMGLLQRLSQGDLFDGGLAGDIGFCYLGNAAYDRLDGGTYYD